VRFPLVRTAVVLVALPLLLPHICLAQKVNWKGPVHFGISNILKLHYVGRSPGSFPMHHCSADDGNVCFGGDHEDTRCLDIPACRSARAIDYLADAVTKEARKRPDDPYAIAQAVYTLTRLDRFAAAVALAQECATATWWCELVLGTALHRSGEAALAAPRFRAGLRGADPELACRLTGIGELLVGTDVRFYYGLSCDERMDFAERFWWLSDPLLTVPGNDRWSEHVNRRFELLLHEKLAWAIRRKRHERYHETEIVRRGFEDSWSRSGGRIRKWTSYRAARYRFTPVSAVSDGMHTLRYDLEPGDRDEGYTPPDHGRFFRLPAQFARFRDGDSMMVAAAARLDATPLDRADASFVAGYAPYSAPLIVGPVTGELRPVFTETVAPLSLVTGIEAFDERGAVAWARRGLEPLHLDGVGLSDPLLLRVRVGELPANRDQAVAAMRATTRIDRGDEMPVYWEVYGLESGQRMDISVSLAGEREGVLTRVLHALGAGADEPAPAVTWVESVSGPTHPMAIAIDIRSLEDGDYTLELTVTGPDGSTAGAERRFEVDRR